MKLTSLEVGLDPEEIGLCCDLEFIFHYKKPAGDQSLCKNGQLHPESEPAKVEIGIINIEPYLSQQSINTIEAHILDYLESKKNGTWSK